MARNAIRCTSGEDRVDLLTKVRAKATASVNDRRLVSKMTLLQAAAKSLSHVAVRERPSRKRRAVILSVSSSNPTPEMPLSDRPCRTRPFWAAARSTIGTNHPTRQNERHRQLPASSSLRSSREPKPRRSTPIPWPGVPRGYPARFPLPGTADGVDPAPPVRGLLPEPAQSKCPGSTCPPAAGAVPTAFSVRLPPRPWRSTRRGHREAAVFRPRQTCETVPLIPDSPDKKPDAANGEWAFLRLPRTLPLVLHVFSWPISLSIHLLQSVFICFPYIDEIMVCQDLLQTLQTPTADGAEAIDRQSETSCDLLI
jgi:hypothetical protein